jgi:hypothetical protein
VLAFSFFFIQRNPQREVRWEKRSSGQKTGKGEADGGGRPGSEERGDNGMGRGGGEELRAASGHSEFQNNAAQATGQGTWANHLPRLSSPQV